MRRAFEGQELTSSLSLVSDGDKTRSLYVLMAEGCADKNSISDTSSYSKVNNTGNPNLIRTILHVKQTNCVVTMRLKESASGADAP